MTVHAMPLMLGVLAALAVAYRYYSAFLAARVAVLDDQRVTPAHTHYDGQNFHPTNKWVLFGHHFAAISGAGPLIGPVLAIQFGYMPGLIWLVVGVCLAGAVQDMLVLAASVRRGGQSLAAIARAEIGRPAGVATAVSILYIVIIALAGLGIVVVKALGGEEIKMKAGTVLAYPEGAAFQKTRFSGGPNLYEVPPGSTYHFGEGPEQSMVFHESFRLEVPGETPLTGHPDGKGWILPEGAKRQVPGSSWGTFTIACTIPIALLVGWYMYRLRPGRVIEASLIGAVLVLAATFAGVLVPGSGIERFFLLSRDGTIAAIAVYGFVASVLPVWLLLAPRDYLSSFLKIGTIALLVLGVLIANPVLHAPAINQQFASGGGPYFDGPIFPYVFICVMCGAISGFHALVSSGTTPKMLDSEAHAPFIGYGAMLMESFVAVMALVAATALEPGIYFAMNSPPAIIGATAADAAAKISTWGFVVTPEMLEQAARDVGEATVLSRTGGAPTLAVGMAEILSGAMGGKTLMAFWYHFAILFEALFILTTIDAGTRVARFMIQDLVGMVAPAFRNTKSWGANIAATTLAVAGWGYFLYEGVVDPLGGINTLWPLFGIANQMLACIALVLCTVILFKMKRERYAWVTALPMTWLAICTLTAGWQKVFHEDPKIGFLAQAQKYGDALARGEILAPAKDIGQMGRIVFNNYIDAAMAGIFIALVVAMLGFGLMAVRAALASPTVTARETFVPAE